MMLADIPVEGVGSAEEGFQRLHAGFPGVVVTDMRLPQADGMEVLRRAQAMDADLPVIIITGHGDVTLAVEAMRGGAYDFIQKPFSPELLVDVVRRALEKRALTLEVLELRRRLEQRDGAASKLIGRSPQMARVRQLVMDLAGTSVDVLVRGETGTGKELIAQCLHELSPRKGGPLVALNCGGLPDGAARQRTLRPRSAAPSPARTTKRRSGQLEYGRRAARCSSTSSASMPLGLQSEAAARAAGKSGRARRPDTIKVDVRVLRHQRRPRASARARRFPRRPVLPPQRGAHRTCRRCATGARTSRRCSKHFLAPAAARRRPRGARRPEPMTHLMQHTWPGNVRELRNVADCIVLGVGKDILGTAASDAPPASLAESVESFERSLIAAELRRQGGSLARSAEALRVAKTTLHDKIKKYGLQGSEG
jgi:two-component system C4-dicarboxylate transport response regulator DctD